MLSRSLNYRYFAENVIKQADIFTCCKASAIIRLEIKNEVFCVARVLVLHGPNLNLLGEREPGIYGRHTLADINAMLEAEASTRGHSLIAKQSNAEHELIAWVHHAKAEGVTFLLFNPGAYTHTSVALRDALLATALPFIEVHLSNPHARESFRRQSYFSDIACAVICGCGWNSYRYALYAADEWLTQA